jgi:hypothetical protein
MKENMPKTEKLFIGTFFYGVIINFVILILLDNFNKSEECIKSTGEGPCTIYPFLLIISLFIGWLVSIIISKIEHRK